MLKSTSHRSIQHAKITKKPQYKNQIERKQKTKASKSKTITGSPNGQKFYAT